MRGDPFRTTVIQGGKRKARLLARLGALTAGILMAQPAGAVAPAPPPSPEYFAPLQSGEALWRSCGGSLYVRAPDRCWAYVTGVADAVRLARGVALAHSCPPSDVQADELADVVRRFLAEHPESRRAPAAEVVGAALASAFPCAVALAR
jgi:hypothetical protein